MFFDAYGIMQAIAYLVFSILVLAALYVASRRDGQDIRRRADKRKFDLPPAKCACNWYDTHGVHSDGCTNQLKTPPPLSNEKRSSLDLFI